MPDRTAHYWIRHFGMQRHPEGGWWAANYQSEDQVELSRFSGHRLAGTAIYFLLEAEDFSAAHRLAADEVWHWYAGSPLLLSWINPMGMLLEQRMGSDPESLQAFQVVVPHHSWMAAHSLGSYTLFGCTMAPGFDETDFELGKRDDLLSRYPQHKSWIKRNTR